MPKKSVPDKIRHTSLFIAMKNTSSLGETLQTAWWAFRLNLSYFPFTTLMLLVAEIFDRVSPLIYAYIFAKVIDILVSLAGSHSSSLSEIASPLIILGVYELVFKVFSKMRRYAENTLRVSSRPKLSVLIAEKLQYLDIQDLEDPEISDKLNRINENVSLTSRFVEIAARLFANVFASIVAAIVMLEFIPWLIPLLLLAVIPDWFVENDYIRKSWQWEFENTEKRRAAYNSNYYLTTVKTLQEVNVLGAYKFLLQKFQDFYSKFTEKAIGIHRLYIFRSFFSETLGKAIVFVGFANVISRFLDGLISIGNVTYQMRAVSTLHNSFGALSVFVSDLRENSTRVAELRDLLTIERKTIDGSIELPRFTTPPTIEVRNVDFQYPRSDKNIFTNLSLKIAPGEKIAIVGHNGAGKTTLVKLLARFYGLQNGEILIDGNELGDLKINDWYKNLGILMQDYNGYSHLTVEDNVYIGRSMKPLDESALEQALELSDAADFVSEYPGKLQQILSEQFKGGTRPSTGQWQKIAIARFFYRNAPVVIFDEPTAAIDAVSEYKIFNRIYDFFKGKTVIIISHRFSTVRNADRILVMDHGQIVEEGSHEALMEKNGKYAEAFRLQAEGYN